MKKSLFKLVLLLLVLSCNKDDPYSGTHFSPPKWIQGEWIGMIEYPHFNELNNFTFTKNNFIRDMDGALIDYNERINWVSEKYFSPTEEITNSYYKINLRAIFFTEVYYFDKLSDSKIDLIIERGDINDWNNREVHSCELTKMN